MQENKTYNRTLQQSVPTLFRRCAVPFFIIIFLMDQHHGQLAILRKDDKNSNGWGCVSGKCAQLCTNWMNLLRWRGKLKTNNSILVTFISFRKIIISFIVPTDVEIPSGMGSKFHGKRPTITKDFFPCWLSRGSDSDREFFFILIKFVLQ